jgi:hypothetical protein
VTLRDRRKHPALFTSLCKHVILKLRPYSPCPKIITEFSKLLRNFFLKMGRIFLAVMAYYNQYFTRTARLNLTSSNFSRNSPRAKYVSYSQTPSKSVYSVWNISRYNVCNLLSKTQVNCFYVPEFEYAFSTI